VGEVHPFSIAYASKEGIITFTFIHSSTCHSYTAPTCAVILFPSFFREISIQVVLSFILIIFLGLYPLSLFSAKFIQLSSTSVKINFPALFIWLFILD